MAHRTSSLFAFTAKQSGKVLSKTDKAIIIEYADKSTKAIEIGRRYGAAEGLTFPHDIVSTVKEGDTFKEGDVLSYHKGFFTPDPINPNAVAWKVGVTVKVALMESKKTLEDASSISKKLSNLLTTRKTSIKTIVVNFDQAINNVIKPGDTLEPETMLCIIEDASTANSGLFNEESLNTLKLLSNQAPMAKVKGTLDKIEVFYHGDKEDMSASLLQLANASDRELIKTSRAMGRGSLTGNVTDDFRVDGDPLMPDTAAIRFYITSEVPCTSGD